MPSVNIEVFGLTEIKNYLNTDRLDKVLVKNIAESVLELHVALKHSVFTRYNPPNDLDKAIVRSSNLIKTGTGFLEQGLQYKGSLTDLSKFPYLPSYAESMQHQGKGQIYTTEVVRGRRKVVHGKYKYGGFVAPRKHGIYPKFMFERLQKATWIGKERAPIRVLQSLTLPSMADIVFRNAKEVGKVLDKLELKIIEDFI